MTLHKNLVANPYLGRLSNLDRDPVPGVFNIFGWCEYPLLTPSMYKSVKSDRILWYRTQTSTVLFQGAIQSQKSIAVNYYLINIIIQLSNTKLLFKML